MASYRVYVTTSDKYLDALKPFAYLFNKYWSPDVEVIIGGFSPPTFTLPPNFHFLSLGLMEDFPIGKWSNALIGMIRFLNDPLFVLMLEDYWLTRPVDTVCVELLLKMMKMKPEIVRMDLTADRKFAGGIRHYGSVAGYELLISDPNSMYHMSLMTAIWRGSQMLRVLVQDETPWDIEISGTDRLRQMRDLIVLGTSHVPVKHTLAFRGGGKGKLLLDEVSEEDQKELQEHGLLEGME